MVASEKKVGEKVYGRGVPSSNTLHKSANKMVSTRKKLRYERTRTFKDFKLMREYEDSHKNAKIKFKENQKKAVQLREQDLEDMAKKRAAQWKLIASRAILVIKNSEEARRTHRKQRHYLKPLAGSIRRIMVLTPISNIEPNDKHITDEQVPTNVHEHDTKEIFNILFATKFSSTATNKAIFFFQWKNGKASGGL